MKPSKIVLAGASALFLIPVGVLIFSPRSGPEGRNAAGNASAGRESPEASSGSRTASPDSRTQEARIVKPAGSLPESRGADVGKPNPSATRQRLADGTALKGEFQTSAARTKKPQVSDGGLEGTAGAAEVPGEEASAIQIPPPPGIRLAPDVRLPVAAMPVDIPLNPVKEKMLKLIVDDYYRDLAGTVRDSETGGVAAGLPDPSGGTGNPQLIQETEDNGDLTVVVGSGPLADAARKRADYRFRAIFGKAAFNRLSMQSSLESRLPVENAPK